jgi:hypothetical protein
MTDEPVTWFHGLIAERTAEFYPVATQVPFFQREIAHFGQPMLDLGCGMRRLLLLLLNVGLDIDGCGISDHISGFRFSLLPNGIHTRLRAGNAHRYQAKMV